MKSLLAKRLKDRLCDRLERLKRMLKLPDADKTQLKQRRSA